MKRVIIMRGLPGSGKSTIAKQLGGVIVSADNYFMVDGVYRFDPTKLGEAHVACMSWFLYHLTMEESIVVVDNTNIRLMELNPYRLVALSQGYDVEIHRVICPPDVAHKRGTHGVPFFTIAKMVDNYEPLPAFMGTEKEIYNA